MIIKHLPCFSESVGILNKKSEVYYSKYDLIFARNMNKYGNVENGNERKNHVELPLCRKITINQDILLSETILVRGLIFIVLMVTLLKP